MESDVSRFRSDLKVCLYEDMPSLKAELIETLVMLEDIIETSSDVAEVIEYILGVKVMIRAVSAEINLHEEMVELQMHLVSTATKWD